MIAAKVSWLALLCALALVFCVQATPSPTDDAFVAKRHILAKRKAMKRSPGVDYSAGALERIKRSQVTARPDAHKRDQLRRRTGPSATTTTTSTCSYPTGGPGSCKVGGGGSDGCTPYTVTYSGLTYTDGTKIQNNGDINMGYITCSSYKPGQLYTSNPGWSVKQYDTHFVTGGTSGSYIGKSSFPWNLAAGYCIVWVQSSTCNQHYGEGGQLPVCNCPCS